MLAKGEPYAAQFALNGTVTVRVRKRPALLSRPPFAANDRSVQTAEARNLKMRNTVAMYAVLGTERLPPTS